MTAPGVARARTPPQPPGLLAGWSEGRNSSYAQTAGSGAGGQVPPFAGTLENPANACLNANRWAAGRADGVLSGADHRPAQPLASKYTVRAFTPGTRGRRAGSRT